MFRVKLGSSSKILWIMNKFFYLASVNGPFLISPMNWVFCIQIMVHCSNAIITVRLNAVYLVVFIVLDRRYSRNLKRRRSHSDFDCYNSKKKMKIDLLANQQSEVVNRSEFSWGLEYDTKCSDIDILQ